jgi:hypothetical protein
MEIKYINVIVILLILSSCSTQTSRQASIDDYKLFPSRTIDKSSEKFTFDYSEQGKYPKKIMFQEENYDFEDFLE